MLDLFQIEDPRVRSLFFAGSIDRRHLELPPVDEEGRPTFESQGELLAKHRRVGLEMGREAILRCLENSGSDLADVRYLCCVTSTGFMAPGFSALLLKELGLSTACSRLDVVGMGCNAGLNAMAAVTDWAVTHPGELAVMVCIEVCSAAYIFDGTMRTAVVNSLFGDGSAAVAVCSSGRESAPGPTVLRKVSCLIPEEIEAMRFDWDDDQGKFSFYIDTAVPYVVGANAGPTLQRLLKDTGLLKSDISHWLIHSGGKKVVDSTRVNLGLTRHEVRHTLNVLREYGNLSSGSFLFSYERLLAEGSVSPGDLGVMMTMGPGSTIEMALLQW
jgi:predicted naringenin-chalcone synthase